MDRDKLSTLGLTASQVENALRNAYATRQVTQIYAPSNQYPVVLRVAPEFQNDPSAMSLLYVRSNSGRLIPLESVARLKTSVGPFQVNHFGQLPSVTISFNLAPGLALGDAVDARSNRRPRQHDPGHGVADVPGHGAGVPGLAARARPRAADGDRRHLHRAGRALRELHAPADDSLRAAGGRPRRAADAADLRRRSEPLRVRRRDHAGRAGEEERHHDGGLRGGRAAPRQDRRPRRSTRRASFASARS